MPHSRLMYYFKDKKDIIMSYVRYTNDYFSTKCIEWFMENHKQEGEKYDEFEAVVTLPT